MGNDKSYYFEGELLPGVTVEDFKKAVYEAFHSTYCVAEIVEGKGGYLGIGPPESGPYLLAAIHSSSQRGDSGPDALRTVFKEFSMHRVDSDWADCWIVRYHGGSLKEWRAHDSTWVPVGT